MNRILLLLGLAAAVLALAASAMSSEDAGAVERAAVTSAGSRFGRILFDGRGFVLYAFTKDPGGRSVCSGACAKAWPPYTVASKPAVRARVESMLVGTTRRADGKLQVTYAGKPLYYYIGDRKPGQILCQNVEEFGGLWLVVRPNGRLVR
jgi:predicted lipoprotein with Yx(FWY)xxD motif